MTAPGQSGLPNNPEIVSVPKAIEEFQAGRPVIIADDEGRENEGDLCIPAQFVTPEIIAFMTSRARGLICIAMTGERLDTLGIPLMTGINTSPLAKGFTVTVEARDGVSTGASAEDKAHTIRVLIDPKTHPTHLTQPGHTFPLRAREGGVLERAGHTEASVDLARLAGCEPAAVICEMILEDGSMARIPNLVEFAQAHGFKIVTVKDLISHRLETDSLIERVAEAELPSRYGDFTAVAYRTLIDTREHIVFVMGDITEPEPTLVLIHDQCVTGDVLGSIGCDCKKQLQTAMQIIANERRGVIVYLYQQGRGIGVHQKASLPVQPDLISSVDATAIQSLGIPDYGIAMQILVDLGVQKMRLITDNPVTRSHSLSGYGLEIVELIILDESSGSNVSIS